MFVPLNANILKQYCGKIEIPQPKIFSLHHLVRREDARRDLETAPYLQEAYLTCHYFYEQNAQTVTILVWGAVPPECFFFNLLTYAGNR